VLVGIDAVNVMAAYQPVVRGNPYADEPNKPYFVVLAKQRIAPC